MLGWLAFLRGPAGPQGERGLTGLSGMRGVRGPEGPPGVIPVPPEPTIRLRVLLVVFYDGDSFSDLSRLAVGLNVAKELREFYLRTCNIDLRITVSGRAMPPWLDREYVEQVWKAHRFQYGGQPFLMLIRADASRVPGDYLGEALIPWGETTMLGGICTVAGEPSELAPKIAVHECGHLLLGPEHLDETFMRATLETENRIVTQAQRVKIRETAYRYGSL